MPFVVGETIGPYRILEQLGRGGMATVFKAYHAALDRYVAIKALHPAFMEDPNFHARFQREARVVAKLEHPNIVPIYDFAEYEDRPYLVMKYIEGETLKARLGQGNIEQADLIQIVESIGTGLFYAHQKGILHRDVKPSNVLLGFDGRVYLADFGLARIAQAGESTLSSDMMLGTPQYISPEQAMGLGELDERTDIYSFGVMLYEMAVGQVPFSADTPFSIIHDHIYTPLPLPRTVNPNVPETVERVLLKALAKEREDRYPDAVALADAFKIAFSAEIGVAPVEISPVPDETYIAEPSEVSETRIPQETVQAGAETQLPVETPVEQKEVSEPPIKPRRLFRWWYIPLGIILIIALCFCGLLAYNSFGGFPDRDEPSAEQLPEIPLVEPFSGGETPFEGEFEAIPLPESQALVNEDPENPDAWLELAASHWMEGNIQEGRDALNQAIELAGDNPDFLFNTAEMLASAQFWVEAAHLYLDGILRFHPDDVPRELRNRLSEAAFWAADQPEAEGEIPIPRIAEVDSALERVVKARYQFYHGDPGDAERILEEVLTKIKPGMPEAMLLQAEIFYGWADQEAALNIIFELLGRDDIPDWIRNYLELLLEDAANQLDAAQAKLEENPDDPWVYLELYNAFLAIGLIDEANDAVQTALRLADDNPEIYNTAGDIAAAHGNWLQAAQLFAQSTGLSRDDVSPEITDKLLQALYYGAAEEGALEIFNDLEFSLLGDRQRINRLFFRDTLIARYKLHYEDIEEAEKIINEVVSITPNFTLARLVEAEVNLLKGDLNASQMILLELEGKPNVTPWMNEEIQSMLEYTR